MVFLKKVKKGCFLIFGCCYFWVVLVLGGDKYECLGILFIN